MRELGSRLQVLLVHLLKWSAQPQLRSRSWEHTIRVQRRSLARLLRDSPSLKSVEAAAFEDAYVDARLLAAAETGLALSAFPETPSFTLGEAKDEAWGID